MLTGKVSLTDFFKNGLVWPQGEEQQKKLTELLKKLFEVGIEMEDDEATKKVLERAFKLACKGTAMLQEYLEGEDVKKILTGSFQDTLVEQLTELLAKKLGKKAAGAIVSVLTDLLNLSDALDKVRPRPAGVCWPFRTATSPPSRSSPLPRGLNNSAPLGAGAGGHTPPPQDCANFSSGPLASPPPPPPFRASSLCPATVPRTPSAPLNGICNRQ